MKKTIAMLCTVLFAAMALADTWTDPETGVTWTYTVSDGKASVGEWWLFTKLPVFVNSRIAIFTACK